MGNRRSTDCAHADSAQFSRCEVVIAAILLFINSVANAATVSPTRSPSAASLFFDNTQQSSANLSLANGFASFSSTLQLFGVTFAVPETDTACGTGAYVIQSVTLGVGTGVSPTVVYFSLQLSNADSATGFPKSGSGDVLQASLSTAVTVASAPGYINLPLMLWSLDTSEHSGKFTLIIGADAPIAWTYPSDGVNAHTPVADAAVPFSMISSSDGGASWRNETAYPSIRLRGYKTICSPTPSQGLTPSQTQSVSQSMTPSQTQSSSQTQSTSQTQSPSQTQSQSRSQTQTPSLTQTASSTQSPSQSVSSSQTLTPTLTQSSSPSQSLTSSQSASGTGTPSETGTGSVTQSPTQSVSATQTQSGSLSPSATGSRSQTISSTQTQTNSASGTRSQSMSSTLSGSPSQSLSQTLSLSQLSTGSQSRSETSSLTGSPSQSQSQTASASGSKSQHATESQSQSLSASQSETPSQTKSQSLSPSQSPSESQSSSQSRSPSVSGTSSQTQSPSVSSTASVSPSLSPTQSMSGSQSQSGSQNVTPSSTQSQSRTASGTRTQTSTRSGTRSQRASSSFSATQTSSGFPPQTVLDNTRNQAQGISATDFIVLDGPNVAATTFYFPEVDQNCGPGPFNLLFANVPLSCTCATSSSYTFTVSLRTYDPADSSIPGALINSTVVTVVVRPTPTYVRLLFVPALRIDTLVSR
jgi:hypothetical protein